jgi:hypothetical protein
MSIIAWNTPDPVTQDDGCRTDRLAGAEQHDPAVDGGGEDEQSGSVSEAGVLGQAKPVVDDARIQCCGERLGRGRRQKSPASAPERLEQSLAQNRDVVGHSPSLSVGERGGRGQTVSSKLLNSPLHTCTLTSYT